MKMALKIMWPKDIKWPSPDDGDSKQHASEEGIYGWWSNEKIYILK